MWSRKNHSKHPRYPTSEEKAVTYHIIAKHQVWPWWITNHVSPAADYELPRNDCKVFDFKVVKPLLRPAVNNVEVIYCGLQKITMRWLDIIIIILLNVNRRRPYAGSINKNSNKNTLVTRKRVSDYLFCGDVWIPNRLFAGYYATDEWRVTSSELLTTEYWRRRSRCTAVWRLLLPDTVGRRTPSSALDTVPPPGRELVRLGLPTHTSGYLIIILLIIFDIAYRVLGRCARYKAKPHYTLRCRW